MTEKIMRLHFNNGEPNIAEMSEILFNKGFRSLTEANDETLPAGSVAVVYNPVNNTMFTMLVLNHYSRGISYLFFNNMNETPEDGDDCYLLPQREINKRYYKKLFQVPMKDSVPQLENLTQCFVESGFRSLASATPDDLPEGCIALIYSEPAFVKPVVVRVMSMSNKRFLYLHQGIVAGDWESSVIMDHLNPFEKYSYLVIS